MLKLDLPVDPFWADLPHGVRVRIKPVTTAIVSAAQHRAARLGREAAEAAGEGEAAAEAEAEAEAAAAAAAGEAAACRGAGQAKQQVEG